MMTKRWDIRPHPGSAAEELAAAPHVSPGLACLLLARGCEDVDTAERFLNPSLDHLHDPFLLPDMEAACARIARAIEAGAADALLLKVNQIGTLTEAAEALNLARDVRWKVTVSARSGETEDDWLADLAVGWGGDQIKVGSINQSERLAKYNRLLHIERETGLPVVAWPNG